MNIISMQTTIQILYKTVTGNKKKERFETILEPLQALIQIALLAYYPTGSKLTIQNNILHIQPPSYSQSVTRWYNNDTQEDLFYLFNIFCRFKKFYTDIKVEHTKLFELLIHLAKNGINNLIRTYNQTDKTHVLHTLQMYKNMLDGTNNTFTHHVASNHVNVMPTLTPIPESNHFISPSSSNAQQNNDHSPHDKNKNKNNNKNYFHDKKNKMTIIENDNSTSASYLSSISLESENEKQVNKKEIISNAAALNPSVPPSSASHSEIDMDTIFIKISDLYTDEIFRIIYNAFIEIGRDDTSYLDYANGLNMILNPINIRIKKWIDDNIVF
jgi:hypothetical protein